MVIDSSAIVAILEDEPERDSFSHAIADSDRRRISAANLLESHIVMQWRHHSEGVQRLDLLIERAAIEVVPIDLVQAQEARRAFSRFGKGLHPAKLNFGDCFAYALAKTLGEPLLFKGRDFELTDVIGWT